MAAMLHARNNTILFLWDKMFILMQNIFIVPGMQHSRHAKSLYRVVANRQKRYPTSDDIIFIHTCDIIFDQSARSIFARCQALLVCCIVRILYTKKKITWSLGDTKFLFLC